MPRCPRGDPSPRSYGRGISQGQFSMCLIAGRPGLCKNCIERNSSGPGISPCNHRPALLDKPAVAPTDLAVMADRMAVMADRNVCPPDVFMGDIER